ncbi:copper resistance D family protein [Kitasatospora sp. McL0602]|uniref:copper resistance D family protein n=1 Tax=Kitasatospora sp. McL0602 TaxID=3439530 RepID=UPI003F891746
MSSAHLAATTAYVMPPLWRVLTKSAYFVGLCGAIGSTVTYAAVLRPALRAPGTERCDAEIVRRRTATYLAWAGAVLLVAGYFQLAARVARAGKGMPFGDALAPGRILTFLTAPAAKGAWVAQGTIHLIQNAVLVLAAATLIALFTPAARRHLDALALIALPLALAVSLIGAIPATRPADLDHALDPVIDQTHIVGGVVWVGGLALLAVLAGAHRRLGAHAGLLWADIWRRFSLVALVCVGAVLVSGLWMSWKHVGSIGQLWTTTYGLFLFVKILLVLGMVAAGGVNQFWLMPRIVRARAEDATSSLLHLTLRHFPRVVWAEVALGAGVLGIVPFLGGSARSQAGSPPPVATGSIFAVGAALALTLAASLYITARVSDGLSRRPATGTAGMIEP